MPDLVGKIIDRYQVLDTAGEDFWGSIYKAYDPKVDRNVALQILDPDKAEDKKLVDHFIQVGRTITGWRHGGIARVLACGRQDAYVFLVREYLPGANLRQILEEMHTQDEWISLDESLHLVRRIQPELPP